MHKVITAGRVLFFAGVERLRRPMRVATAAFHECKVSADRFLGLVGFALALVFLVPSWVTGIGTAGELVALLIAGFSALRGNVVYVTVVAVIVTIDLAFFSVLTEEGIELGLLGWSYVIGPYLLAVSCVAFGLRTKKRQDKPPSYKIPFRRAYKRSDL